MNVLITGFDPFGGEKTNPISGLPSAVSYTAGTFVCNHQMYGVLHHLAISDKKRRGGFLHIPYLLEQTVNKPDKPGFTLDTLVSGIEGAILACLENETDKEGEIVEL